MTRMTRLILFTRFLLWLYRAALGCVTDSEHMHLPVFDSLSGVQIGMPFRTWSGSLSFWVPVSCSCRGVLLTLSSMLSLQRGTVVCWWRAQTLENHLHKNLIFHHFLPMWLWASVFYLWNEDITMTCLKAYCEDWMSECILEECLVGGTHLMCICCC